MRPNRLIAASVLACVLSLTLLASCRAQTTRFMVNPETGESQAQFAQRTAWWRQAKFGMFIHWGIYSVPNSDHANTTGMGEWWLSNHQMQVADYEKYASHFDPTQFNALDWVKLAKDAGMKYIVITAKHHDGFCMFDTKLTHYNVVDDTPWHHDPMKDLAAACRREGIKLCFYYSFMDWHNPDYLPRRSWDTRPIADASMDRYIKYVKGQLHELLTQYGPIGGIWFDGGWEHSAGEMHSLDIVRYIRSIQPGIMINDRLRIPEDYSLPEQTIPSGTLPDGRLWETCMTINDHWGYAWNDDDFKPVSVLVRNLCDIASKGGNFLLNVGPDDRGMIPQPEVDRLEAVGRWMKKNGQCIYGTTASPYTHLPFDGRSTVNDDTLYLEVFEWPPTGIKLAGLTTAVRQAECISDHHRLSVSRTPEGRLEIGTPPDFDPVATVVALRLTGPPTVNPLLLAIRPAADGSFALSADEATINGNSPHTESYGGITNIGYWTDPKDTVSWLVRVPAAGEYSVSIEYSCATGQGGTPYSVAGSEGTVQGVTADTGGWDQFVTAPLTGTLTLPAGIDTIQVIPGAMAHDAVMNLRKITLTPSAAAT